MAQRATTSDWLPKTLPFVSALITVGSLWYCWTKYHDMMDASGTPWQAWIRVAFIGVMGILCLAATVLFVIGKRSGWTVLELGLFMVPALMFTNLIVLLVRAVISLFQGHFPAVLDRALSSPGKFISIPIVIFVIVLLGVVSKENPNKQR
jgi:hypothetical protein